MSIDRESENTRVGRIAFIGLGVMGLPMARHLAKAATSLTVYSRTIQKAEPLRALGARVATSVLDAVSDAEVVITMLPDTPDVISVLEGPNGVIENVRPGTAIVDMSTISAAATRRLATLARARGVQYVDAPVSGGERGANEATLSIMVGGRAEDVEGVLPVLRRLGRTIRHIGPVGGGQVAKACNQIVVGVTIQALSEALVVGAKAGLDPAILVDVFGGGLARCGVLETRGTRMIDDDFEPGFRMRLHHKDLTVALELAADVGVPIVATALVREQMRAALAAGEGDFDHTALVRVVERLAGVTEKAGHGREDRPIGDGNLKTPTTNALAG